MQILTLGNIFSLPLHNPVLLFAVVLLIILFAPIIFTKLRIPHIVGLIAAGIIVGPHGLNIILRDSSIELFSTVGLLYIMFIAGVEVDINGFKRNKVKSIVFSAYSFVIPMALGVTVGLFALGYNLETSLLLASMFASHTLLAYPIVSRYGITKIRSVSMTVVATVIIDTLSLLTLAVVVGNHKGDLDALHWMRFALLILAFGVAVLFGLPLAARHFFKRNTDSVAQYIFALSMMFLAAFFAQLIGMEGIIGAFLAGIALNKLIPSTSALMNRIDFVGNALFIPIFLISVGMLVDLRVFFTSFQAVAVAAVMTAAATIGKYAPAYLTQKTFKLKRVERTMIFGLSNAHAAATLAVVIVGRQIGLFNDDVLNGTIVMILVTCIVSSFATERASRRIAAQTKLGAKIGRKFGKILIPVSNPDTIERLVDFAIMVRNDKSHESLYAVYISNRQHANNPHWEHGDRILEKAAFCAAASDVALEMIHHADNNAARGIVKVVKEQSITDIVLGLHQSASLGDELFGMRLSTLLKETSQTIFVAKLLHQASTIQRIVTVIPPHAEYEAGFARWLYRLGNLHRQTNAKLVFYGNANTLDKVNLLNQSNENAFEIQRIELSQWPLLHTLADKLRPDDLLVAVAARKTAVSYAPAMERLHAMLGKYFTSNSVMIIYPEQYVSDEEQVKFLSGGK
ncbi:MAG: cation:proton antiporter [Prevotellaceae bacterium]|jgi:Kef-type K+ transport system membrane component KefB|nr:cation:proton antiporter [Prevotellaceae bacterium]